MAESRTSKVLALSLGNALTQAVTLGTGILLARMMTQVDFATYRQTLLVYSLAAPLLALALPEALYFFLPQHKGEERRVLLTVLTLLGMSGALFSGFLYLGGATLIAKRFNNPDLAESLRLFAPFPMFMLPAAAISACLVAREKVRQLTVFNVLSRLLLGVALIAACLYQPAPRVLIMVHVAVAGAVLLPAVRLMLRACPGVNAFPTPQRVWETIKYSGPVGLAAIIGTLSMQLSGAIVAAMCSPEDFAIYSVGAVEIPLIGIVTGSITSVLMADMSRLCREGNKAEALRLFHTGALRSAAILFPAMIFLFQAADPFIECLFSSKYSASATPFRLLLLLLPARVVTFGAALIALGETRKILIRSIVELGINSLLAVVLVRSIGFNGALVATILTVYGWSVAFNLFTIARGFSVPYGAVMPWRALLRVFAWSALLGPVPLLYRLLPDASAGIRLAASALYLPAVFCVLITKAILPLPRFLSFRFCPKQQPVSDHEPVLLDPR